MFEAAREYNRLHPETVVHFDVTGYEYSLVRPYESYRCVFCGKEGLGVQGVTGYVRESYYDPDAPLGRSQRMVGDACSEECAFSETDSLRNLVQFPSRATKELVRESGGQSNRSRIRRRAL